jgi:hypothetical protein
MASPISLENAIPSLTVRNAQPRAASTRNPDAIEAVFKKLNADDEAERARRDLGG